MDLSKLSDEELASLAASKGIIQEAEKPSLLKKALAFGVGAAENVNPLNIPHSLETLGRAAVKGMASDKPVESPTGLIVPGGGKSFAEAVAEADKESLTPDLSIHRGVEATLGKDYLKGTEGYETAGGLAGMAASLGYGGVKALAGALPRRAANAESGVIKSIKYLTGEAEGPVMESMLKRPDKVKALMERGDLSPHELALKVSDELAAKQKLIGESVDSFKQIAKADNKPSINVSKELQRLNRIEDELTLSSGASALDPSEIAEIAKIRGYFPEFTKKGGAKISPRDAVIITDKLAQINEKLGAKPGSVSATLAFEIRDLRRNVKAAARESTGVGKEWALADDAYETFMENSKGLIDKFAGDMGESKLDNLFGKGKTPIRERLSAALDAGETGTKKSDEVFNSLSDIKAAQGMKSLDVTKADPIKDTQNRIFQEWRTRGTLAGAAVGGGVGAKIMGPMGSVAGAPVGGLVGRIAVEPLARKLASPWRLLDKAQKAKDLSDDAKALAKDLSWLQKKIGPEAAFQLWNAVERLPVANTLSAYLQKGSPKQ